MTINKLALPKNRLCSIYGSAGSSSYDKGSLALATDWRRGLLARGASHHPCAADGVLLEEAHGVFGSRIPGRCGLYGPGQLGYRFGRRRAVRLLASMRHHDFQSDGDP